ncbi:MAG: hypothetical protein ACOX4Z_09920 [Desulfobulbus sp.]
MSRQETKNKCKQARQKTTDGGVVLMRQRKKSAIKKLGYGTVLVFFLFAGQAWAHTPLCSCYDNGDGTITCEGGFSDGSSASGVKMRVEKQDGAVLLEGQMNATSEFTFNKPEEDYKVVFDGGEGHRIEINSKDILE